MWRALTGLQLPALTGSFAALNLAALITGRLPQRARPLALTSLYGLAAGLSAVGFEVGINLLFNHTFLPLSRQSPGIFLLGSFAVMVGSSLIAGYLLANFCPEAAGSGIPQLKLAFWKEFGYVPARTVWVKFIAGLLTVGGGSSLGREGPTVHIAGGVASNLAGQLGVAKNGRRQAAAAGAAAGLAAAFNAPLASITFVLEEIIEDLNSRLLGAVIVAAVLGAFTVHALIGSHPAFDLPTISAPSWRGYLLTPAAAAFAALVGAAFQWGALRLRRLSRRQSALGGLPMAFRPAVGAAISWLIGVAIFLPTGRLGIFSLGYDDLTQGLNNLLSWRLALALLAGKFFATVLGYGTGGCGGIFAPNLFLGAMCGAALSGLARAAGLPMSNDDHALLTIIGMSSCLGAVVRAPLTSILIVFEMTHEFALVPALLFGCLVSQAISRSLSEHNFYEQALVDQGHALRTVMPPRDLRSFMGYPVAAIANFAPVVLRAPQDLEPDKLQAALEAHPYSRFPVEGEAPGLLLRAEALQALAAQTAPTVHPAEYCLREASIREAQAGLLASEHGVTLILDKPAGAIVGLLTLHDLLRSQDAMTQADGA